MAQATAKVFEFPAGGIADFYMEDHEIEALEREEAAQEFGSSGIATFEPIANRMASYGRYGDDTVAHVETGELIVPKALIDDNPKLRDSIFSHLRDLGVEDPERYVVGSGVNSINPETGMPEFFLKKIFKGVKKAASKVVKGVSKALKGVTKVIKKAAPVIIPFALNAMFPGLGAIYSGALGAGIGTLVQGGNLKDAFKNALIGGAIGGATAGVQGAFGAKAAGKTISQGAFDEIAKQASFSNLQTAGQQLATGQFGQAGLDAVQMSPDAFAEYSPDKLVGEVVEKATDFGAGQGPYDPNLSTTLPAGTDAGLDAATRNELYGVTPRPAATTTGSAATTAPAADSFTIAQQEALQKAAQPAGFLESGSEFLKDPSLSTFKDLTLGPDAMTTSELLSKAATENPALFPNLNPANIQASSALGQAATEAAKASAPGLVRSFAIPAAAAVGTTALLGGFTPQELDEMSDEERLAALGPSAYDEYMANKAKYDVGGYTPTLSQGQYVVPTIFPQQSPILPVAEGGEIFPRRVGGIMPDEGTPGKDSVKAMLMPGEFVMTTNAVKGLGDGDNNKGINRMYDMMRGLEAKGKAMA
jgi:hypothetical protein